MKSCPQMVKAAESPIGSFKVRFHAFIAEKEAETPTRVSASFAVKDRSVT